MVYDGTLAHHGVVDAPTIEALETLKASGRKLLMVTGRELPDLQRVFDRLDLFDLVVAENGSLLYTPATQVERVVAEAPPDELVAALRTKGVQPLSVGRGIVATWEPNEGKVLEAIRELGLEWQIIFNKGAVMVLPPGVNKATGLAAALLEMRLSPLNVVAIGDAENDHAFLTVCGCSVAVSNALNLRAQNLEVFLQIADGVDDATWLHHLRRGGYARWFPQAIKMSWRTTPTQGFRRRLPRTTRMGTRRRAPIPARPGESREGRVWEVWRLSLGPGIHRDERFSLELA